MMYIISINFILDNCKVEKNEMICYLSKEKIESFGAIVADDYETQLNVLTLNKKNLFMSK